ncbi:MAG TPA: hypothetical protein HA346_07450 [Thermoplasmata archaeon]|nr:hypothetical protein [Thermoplasmata archaeon]
MELIKVDIEKPPEMNFILGQTHFIKSVEDLYEAIATTVPQAKFGIAFCEASGVCLIRSEGNDEKLKRLAVENANRIGAGHSFIVFLEGCYPINVLPAIKSLQEVCGIYCATSNPTKVLVAEERVGEETGRAIIGVVDGFKPKGVEGDRDIQMRKEMLRKIGYKR